MTPSVLVVEDYADLCSAIVGTLSRRKYECESAQTPEDAIVKLRAHRYETILLAPRLPITADPVMHFLHEHQPDQVSNVVLMTAPDDDPTDPDACRVLSKPFNPDELFATLKPAT
jgi:DNA-binding response OmpR family regulator